MITEKLTIVKGWEYSTREGETTSSIPFSFVETTRF